MIFRLGQHTIRPGVPVVEVWEAGEFIAQLVPGVAPGELRIVSKHEIAVVDAASPDNVAPDLSALALFIRFWE